MKNNLIPVIKDFMKKEKIDLSISQDNSFEFWLDDTLGSITVRFKINNPKQEVIYDVYSPELSTHLKEETIKDVERLEFLAEDDRKWKFAEGIENIWLILDRIKLWARQNDFKLMEKHLI